MGKSLAVISLALVFGAGRLGANEVIFVRSGATGSATGSSWGNAFPDLPPALAAAQSAVLSGASSGVQVWVAAGTYSPDPGGANPALSFDLVDGVALYGGFAGTETCLEQRDWVANPTILSGDLSVPDLAPGDCRADPVPADFDEHDDNSYHVVRAISVGSTTILDGFTVRGGNARGVGLDAHGGGILIVGSSLQVRNCEVLWNTTRYGGAPPDENGGDGAGIYCFDSSPTIRDSTICSNLTGEGLGSFTTPGRGGNGGGIALVQCAGSGAKIVNCSILDNATGRGSLHTIPYPDGPEEHRGGDGGGLWLFGTYGATVEATLIRGNRCGEGGRDESQYFSGKGGSGGGVAASSSVALLDRCWIDDNRTGASLGGGATLGSGDGGGAHLDSGQLTARDCLFSQNRTEDGCIGCGDGGTGAGGAICLVNSAWLLVATSSFEGNATGQNGGEFYGGQSGNGGAISSSQSSLSVSDCRFTDNRTGFGGLAMDAASSGSGGAIWTEGNIPALIGNSTFAGNRTGDSGPNNGDVGSGGAIGSAMSGSTTWEIVNCTFTDNRTGTLLGIGSAGFGGGIRSSADLCVYNSILYANEDSTGATATAQLDTPCVQYSCVQGLAASGTNIAADPLFVDGAGPAYDLQLLTGSPCIDNGGGFILTDFGDRDGDGDTAEPVPLDISGRRRVLGAPSVIDRGAHEYQSLRYSYTFPDISVAFASDSGEAAFSLPLVLEELPPPVPPPFAPTGVSGLQIRFAYDTVLVQSMGVSEGSDLAAVNSGSGPEFFDVESGCPGFVQVGILLQLMAVTQTIVADVPKEIIIAEFATVPSSFVGSTGLSTTIRLQDGPNCVTPSLEFRNVAAPNGPSMAAILDPGVVYLAPGPGTALLKRGDCNADDLYDIADVVYSLGYSFPGSGVPNHLTCQDACDANDDGAVNIADAIFTLSRIFAGGPPPPAPSWPTCGGDPTSDSLCCAGYAPCR